MNLLRKNGNIQSVIASITIIDKEISVGVNNALVLSNDLTLTE